ncbi:Uncharacterised protein [Klebsiella pneumoniae]|uniref:Uncharacterized protein n=1 Tax=Klebsiella pneumoniae TaxID=573 RepID=A0A447RZM0_KLEPN|nr:Uncharacterised protein [Klebsiella pneumoniae]
MMSLRTLIAMITSSSAQLAGAFADTVHRTFYLARTGVDRGEGVTDSDAQIIMGVDGNNCFGRYSARDHTGR